MAQAW